MADGVKVAVVGATGAVGEAMLSILAERDFPVAKLWALASEGSVGKTVTFGGRSVPVENAATFDFSQAQLGLFSAGASVSEVLAPRAAAAGCTVVDNTSRFRYDDDVPLVVPEVNAHALDGYRARNIIANPNCSTIQMLVALKPLHDLVKVKRINVATYQAVSGAGRRAIENLAVQTATLMNGRPLELPANEPRIAFNAVPQIDVFQDNGYTKEEMKMVWETQKILEDPGVRVNATAVRVPVFHGHSEALHIETETKLTADEARAALAAAPGVTLVDDVSASQAGEAFPTAATQGADTDAVFVGRVREDLSHPTGLNLWVVSDNLRKGAALNSVQIAEILVKDYL
ncbi:MAG: aspartate-semialdehyde dehydrogenase [Pseudomonadota bacterium]